MMTGDPSLVTYMKDYDYVEPINARQAFFGGRTNGLRMYYACRPEEVNMSSVVCPKSYDGGTGGQRGEQ